MRQLLGRAKNKSPKDATKICRGTGKCFHGVIQEQPSESGAQATWVMKEEGTVDIWRWSTSLEGMESAKAFRQEGTWHD